VRCKIANRPGKGEKKTVEPIRKLKDIKAIKKILADKPRDLLLFTLGINNGLRAGDLLKLKVFQVKDQEGISAQSNSTSSFLLFSGDCIPAQWRI